MVKKLRYYARFIVVSVLLNKVDLVKELMKVGFHRLLKFQGSGQVSKVKEKTQKRKKRRPAGAKQGGNISKSNGVNILPRKVDHSL